MVSENFDQLLTDCVHMEWMYSKVAMILICFTKHKMNANLLLT